MKAGLAEAYIAELEKRMKKGAAEYGDKSWSRDPIALLSEIQEELADVAGWAGILWGRMQRMKDALNVIQAKDKAKPK